MTTTALVSEVELLRTLDTGIYTLAELYERCEVEADIERDGGQTPIGDHHGADTVSRRRLRNGLQHLKAKGNAHRVDKACWAIDGTTERRRMLVLVLAGGEPGEVELRIERADRLLAQLDEPVDLVVCDPPYGLRRDDPSDSRRRLYSRDARKVIGGYVDVEPEAYAEFTYRWIDPAAGALRAGGQLVVISGPQRAAVVQTAAEEFGLNWVATIAAKREFAMYTTRRPSCAHWAITVMCRGPVRSRGRVFNAPDDLPRSQAGNDYPLDLWLENGRADRPGVLRYDNALPPRMVRRIVRSFCDLGMLVVDPCLGSGETAIQCHLSGRRCIAGDVNAEAIDFAAARLLAEHAWPNQVAPRLFAA